MPSTTAATSSNSRSMVEQQPFSRGEPRIDLACKPERRRADVSTVRREKRRGLELRQARLKARHHRRDHQRAAIEVGAIQPVLENELGLDEAVELLPDVQGAPERVEVAHVSSIDGVLPAGVRDFQYPRGLA